jgi:glutamate:Na+ symporter, ESS family
MSFWESGSITTLLSLAILLALAGAVRRLSPRWAALGIPGCILAGLFGLLAGPGVLDWVPLDTSTLESIVYHGLALTFIALGLQTPPENASTPDAMSMGLGISAMAALQAVIGMGVVLILGLGAASALHPGLGLLLPLGYNQGPGQAMSMGNAWEASGLVDGGQIGLIIAAAGFAWAIIIGIPLVAYARRQGWFEESEEHGIAESGRHTQETQDGPGALDPLTTHLVAIGVVYALTYGILLALSAVLASRPKLMAMIWGFHFLIALGLALIARKLWPRLPTPELRNDTLSRVANLVVDLVTCSALAAIQVAVLTSNWLPILVITLAGIIATFFGVLWLSARGFKTDRFQHAILWFGTSTGTLPMGLALLRLIDPNLRSAAPTSATQGAVFALFFSAPLLLFVMPYPVAQWPAGHPTASYITIAVLSVYLIGLLILWRSVAGLKINAVTPLWTPDDAAPGDGES